MQMRTVAERAGVALGTLYRYFPSKMDLVVAVVGEEIDLLESSIERRPPQAANPAGRAVDVLMRATRGLMREPELADALIRSLIMAEVEAPFGDRMASLLLRVATEGRTVSLPRRTSSPSPAPWRGSGCRSCWRCCAGGAPTSRSSTGSRSRPIGCWRVSRISFRRPMKSGDTPATPSGKTDMHDRVSRRLPLERVPLQLD